MCVFNELNETLGKAVNSYENIIVIGYLNINVSDPNKDRNNYLMTSLALSHYQI